MATEKEQLAKQKITNAKKLRDNANRVAAKNNAAIAKAQAILAKTKDSATRIEQQRNIAQWKAEIDDANRGADEAEKSVSHPIPIIGGDVHGGAAPLPAADAVSAFRAGERQSLPVTKPLTVDPTPPNIPIPTDPKGFQHYLNAQFGAGLVEDGRIGPKTLAAAAKFHVAVPQPAAPTPAPAATTPIGGTSDTSAADAAAEAATAAGNAAQAIAAVKAQYGYLGAVLDNPEVMKALEDAQARGVNPGDATFTALIMSTSPFANASRNIVGFDFSPPGEQKALVGHAADAILKQAKLLGVDIASDRLQQIAHDAARLGWSADSAELSNAIAAEFHYTPGAQHGSIGVAESQIKSLASLYFLPMSDNTLADLDKQVAAGTFNPDDFRTYAIEQAKSLYNSPAVARLLDKGMTMDQIADPYRQDAARELEMDPNAIDFQQPQWMKALSTTDPATGTPGMMSRAQWVQTLRGDPQYGWDRTKNGKSAYVQMATQLVQSLGLRG